MKNNPERKRAVNAYMRTAMSAAIASNFGSGVAVAQDTPPSSDATQLDTIEVTGSRIRRVDTETASPIYTIDRATIESSGVTTLGELVQEAPAISGAASNPQVNNGGGDGAARVSLRGLGDERTLVLLNGRRLGPSFDLNAIPINLIERVEILKEGAGAIYGSDAVGGVVNFITRKSYSNADIAFQAGASSEEDGQNQSVEGSFGLVDGKGSLMLGVNYNKQKEISAANRAFSKNALYVYNYYGTDTILVLGSSRNPRGRITLPVAHPLRVALGCTGSAPSVSRIAGQDGDTATSSDYQCYNGARDSYDYQPYNLIVTPQERGSLFTVGSYKINDQVEAFTELFHNFTQSGFVIAPLPFDARSDNVILSQNSIYNPMGIDFGGSSDNPSDPLNPNFLTRFVTNGNRFSEVETTTDQVTVGARGGLGSTTWNWDLGVTYQHFNQFNSVSGYVRQTDLQNALGPSFVDDNGTPGDTTDDVARCGAPGVVIPGCTPINLFNTEDPDTISELARLSTGYENQSVQTTKAAILTFSGDLFRWAPGTVMMAAGVNLGEDKLKVDVDGLTQAAPPEFSNCGLSNETCSGDTGGDESLWEIFGEALIPLMSDAPGAQALNLTLGLRHSDYDSFGTTDNITAKLEYRPINDLMARISFAEVFRAPQIFDRFGAPASSAPLFFDPCVGLTAADVAANPNYAQACENVAQDGSFAGAPTQQVDQLILSNSNLRPETGDVLTGGFVYDPSWLPNISTTIDYWRYQIDDAIIAPDVNTIATSCVETGDSALCDLIIRFSDGQIDRILSPTLNSASFTTSGFDFGVKYNNRSTPIGTIRAGVDITRTTEFKYRILPNSAEVDAAGTYDAQFGNYAKLRATGTVAWGWQWLEAQLTTRHIDGVDIAASIGQGSGRPAATAPISIPSITYHDLSLGFNLPGSKTKFLVGVENAFDKQPPLFYQYALNANTNVETYDAVGRFFLVRVSQSF
jgi:outer membrane receptor protein involved in Fe transport